MDFLSDFAAGMTRQGEESGRKRRELAQAFQLFRQGNPHASLEEMQQYIDAQSGGRNYIAGGAPSGSVLKSIAEQNAKARSRAEMTARLAQLEQQTKASDLIDTTVNRALADNNGDLVATYETVRSLVGDDFDVRSKVTPARWQGILQQKTIQNYPAASAYLADTVDENGNVTVTAKNVAESFGVPEQVAANILGKFQKEAKLQAEAQKRKDEEHRRAQERSDAEYLTKLQDRLLGDPIIQGALRKNDLETARKRVDNMVGALPEDIRRKVPEGWRDTTFKGIVNNLQLLQDDELSKHRDTAREHVTTLVSGVAENNRKFITQAISSGQANHPSDKDSPVVKLALSELGEEYQISGQSLSILSDLALQNPQAGSGELAQLGRTAFANAGVLTLDQKQKQVVEGYNSTHGVVDNDMPYSDWHQSAAEDISEEKSKLTGALDAAMNIADPKARIAHLNQIIAQSRAKAARIVPYFQNAEKNSDRILTVGTGGWDQKAANDLVKSATSMYADTISRAEQSIKAAVSEVQMAPPAETIEADGERSSFRKWQDEKNLEGKAGRDFESVRSDHGNPVWDWFLETEAKYKADAFMRDFLKTEGVRDRFMSDHEFASAFQADPWGVLQTSDQDWVKTATDRAIQKHGGIPDYYLKNR